VGVILSAAKDLFVGVILSAAKDLFVGVILSEAKDLLFRIKYIDASLAWVTQTIVMVANSSL
jgi:hypothetical protein